MTPSSSVYAGEAFTPGAALREYHGIESPPSLARKTVELLYYLTIVNSAFTAVTWLWQIPFLGGGAIVLATVICLAITVGQGERLPASVWFAAAMNVGATLSQARLGQMPIFGEGLNFMFLWICQTLLVCYLVRNEATRKRMLFMMALGILFAVLTLGEFYGSGYKRFRVEKDLNVGGLGNANNLGLQSGLFAMAVLFWSLRAAKTARVFLWSLALALLALVILSVSRSAVLTCACGLATLAVAVLFGRGVRIGGILMILFALFALSQAAFLVSGAWEVVGKRMQEHSIRTEVYSWETVEDLMSTLVFGRGVDARTRVGIQAHNTFLVVHMSYGGITAYCYLAWLVFLGVRVFRFLQRRDMRLDLRLEVLCMFGMMLAHHFFSNLGFVEYACLYAVAVIEKYTAPPLRRR